MVSDSELRKQIRDAIVQHSSEVGLGLRCPECGQTVEGGDWMQQIRDAFDPNKNGLNASIADTKAKFDDFGRKVKNEFENPDSKLSDFGRKVANELGNENSHFRRGLKGFVSGVKEGINTTKDVVNAVKEIKSLRGNGLRRKKLPELTASVVLPVDGDENPVVVEAPTSKGKRKWSEEAKARARARAQDKNSHGAKVKAYMKKHGVSLAEASKAVSSKK